MTRPITAVKWNQTAAAFAEYFARLQGSVCNILVFGARTTFLSPKRGKKWKIQNNFGDTCDEDKGTATPLRKHFANFDSIVLKAGCSGLIDTLHVFFSTKTGNVFATIVSCKHATWYLAWRGFCGGKCENFDNANAKKKQWPETGAKQITNYLNAIFPTWTPLKKKISCTIISPKGGMHQDHVGSWVTTNMIHGDLLADQFVEERIAANHLNCGTHKANHGWNQECSSHLRSRTRRA